MGDRPTITTTDGFLILIVTVMYKNNMKTPLIRGEIVGPFYLYTKRRVTR